MCGLCRQTVRCEVLSKHTHRQLPPRQLFLPIVVMRERIAVNRLVLSTVHGQVRLTVTIQIKFAQSHAARHRFLENSSRNRLPAPHALPRQPDIQRHNFHSRQSLPCSFGQCVSRGTMTLECARFQSLLKPPAKPPLWRNLDDCGLAFLKSRVRFIHFEFLVQTLANLQEKRALPDDLRRTLHHHSAHVLPIRLVLVSNQRHNAMMLQIRELRGVEIRRPVNLLLPNYMANRRNLRLAIPAHRSYSNHRSITQKFHLLRFRPRHIVLPVSFDEMTARPAWTLSRRRRYDSVEAIARS